MMFASDDPREYQLLVEENLFIDGIQFAIERALSEGNLTQADLASRIGVSEARVSKMLSDGGKNLQARTIARVAAALGLRARLEFCDPTDTVVRWEAYETSDRPTETIDLGSWVSQALEAMDRAPAVANDNPWADVETSADPIWEQAA